MKIKKYSVHYNSLIGNKKKFFYSACIIKEHIIIIKLIGKIFNLTTCSPELYAFAVVLSRGPFYYNNNGRYHNNYTGSYSYHNNGRYYNNYTGPYYNNYTGPYSYYNNGARDGYDYGEYNCQHLSLPFFSYISKCWHRLNKPSKHSLIGNKKKFFYSAYSQISDFHLFIYTIIHIF
jgi:hypothetical protein